MTGRYAEEVMLTVRAARADDRDAIWAILEPVIRAGDTYTLPRQMSRDEALASGMQAGTRFSWRRKTGT